MMTIHLHQQSVHENPEESERHLLLFLLHDISVFLETQRLRPSQSPQLDPAPISSCRAASQRLRIHTLPLPHTYEIDIDHVGAAKDQNLSRNLAFDSNADEESIQEDMPLALRRRQFRRRASDRALRFEAPTSKDTTTTSDPIDCRHVQCELVDRSTRWLRN